MNQQNKMWRGNRHADLGCRLAIAPLDFMFAQRKIWLHKYSESEIRKCLVFTGISFVALTALTLWQDDIYTWFTWATIGLWTLLFGCFSYTGIRELKRRRRDP